MYSINNLYGPVRERIFTLLKSKKISQKEFAEGISVPAVTITDWKKGRSFSFMKKLAPIADALDTTEIWLLTGKNTAQNAEALQKVEKIADSLGVHPLDLIGDKRLNQYRIDVEFKEGTPPEAQEAFQEELSKGYENVVTLLSLQDQIEFHGIMEQLTLMRNIDQYCEQKGIAPENAWKESGAKGTYPDAITKNDDVPLTSIQRLAAYLDVTTSELLSEEKPTPVSEDGQSPLDQRLNELLAVADDKTKQAMIAFLEQLQKP